MIDLQSLRAALAAGGLVPDHIEAGRLQRCAVEGDRRGKKSGAYRLFDDNLPTCVWWNWKAGSSGVWVSGDRPQTAEDLRRERERIELVKQERLAVQTAQWERNARYLSALWDAAQPVPAECSVAWYLMRRGLSDASLGDALRYTPALDYWDERGRRSYPAMLGAVTGPDGKLVSIHRTYLTRDGYKAPEPTVKKLTRTAGPMAGASIKIGSPVVRRRGGPLCLGVAEGIETALAASVLSGVPVWSCVSAHGLATFIPPPDVRNLYIFADNDESGAGLDAASLLAQSACRSGLTVRILVPEAIGDWADELVTRNKASV